MEESREASSNKAWGEGEILEWDWMANLSNFLKVFMAFLQGSGAMQRLPHPRVFAEKRLTVVLNPVKNLLAQRKKN